MKKLLTLCCIAGVATTSGCASILSDSKYPVTISSTPPGATVVVKNKTGNELHKAQTPTTVTLNASAGFFSPAKYTLEFEKDGFQKSTASIDASMDGWYVGNILFGGLIGLLIVDPATGAMWKLDDNVTSSLATDPDAAVAAQAQPVIPAEAAISTSNAGDPSPEPSAADQLKELKKLKDDGIITEQEYAQKRAPLVERL